MSRSMILLGALSLSLAAGALQAQDEPAGKEEFMVACAVCHGESAMGNGPFSSMMNAEVPGLTGLAAANDGVFPYLKVFQIVDGRTGMRAHGSPMPIWGDRFSASANGDYGPYRAEIIARGRIAVLVDYIESIQE